MNKQKLPKYITVHEGVGAVDGFIVLKDTRDNTCWAINQDVKEAYNWLEKGWGWPSNKTVGKQIII